jgi:hypothetical protein
MRFALLVSASRSPHPRHGGRRRQYPSFDTFRSLARVGTSVEAAMVRTVPPHVQAFVAHTMVLARSGSSEEVLAAFFYGREDIIGDVHRLQRTLPGARRQRQRSLASFHLLHRAAHRARWRQSQSNGATAPGLVADSPQRDERALRAACNSIKARIELWDGTLSTLREMRAA